ncbi:MAG: cardiolipin synthase [Clostridia bacterium]|nr:cardiolipin synthase [Clostridia bacterium]
MKKKYSYVANGKTVEREYNYIPVRYIIAILITVVEIAAIIGIVIAFCYYIPYFYILAWATEIGVVVSIAASDDNPDYKIPWLLCVICIPIGGFMLYFLFYNRRLQPKFVKRLKQLGDTPAPADDASLFDRLEEENRTVSNQARMLCHIADTHLYTDTAQTYFPSGRQMFDSMLCDLANAEKFIYMEYFIVEEGLFWNSILDILRKKAKAGVEVRILYDDVGCMTTLPGDYCLTLKRDGINAVPFSRLRGNADSEFNNRSHRKILVIDGKVGYTGGVNIADEYIGEVIRFGHWKDTGIRLSGEAVWELTRLFLCDWGINVRRLPEVRSDLYPACENTAPGYLIPFGDGPSPIYRRRIGKSVIQNMLYGAQRSVIMTSPYLIIDNDLCQDIENTAMRGVNVKIIVPHIPDKKIVFGMTRSYYSRLMDAGVEIYEYEPGFIHAKSYLVDDELAMIGTINLDYRSLVHHFENGVWMYRCEAVRALRKDLDDTLGCSIRVTRDMLKMSVFRRAFRSVVRIFAPLL